MKKYKVNELFERWSLTNLKVNTKFLNLEFEPTDGEMSAAWDLYIELITRVATQELIDDMGDEASALESIYNLFGVTRTILKEKGRYAPVFSRIAVIVLNQVIRPFTSKWHKVLLKDGFNNASACDDFRNEIKVLQQSLRNYSMLLADLANVEDLTDIQQKED